MTKIFLIRHGQTQFSLEKRYCGSTDAALCEKGRENVVTLRNRMDVKAVQFVITSDMKRAIETAEILFPHLSSEFRAVEPSFRELNFGAWEGLHYDEVMEGDRERYQQWINEWETKAVPDGESLQDLQKRVIQVFKETLQKFSGQTIAIVCHGGPISILQNYMLKEKKLRFWDYVPMAASMIEIIYENEEYKFQVVQRKVMV